MYPNVMFFVRSERADILQGVSPGCVKRQQALLNLEGTLLKEGLDGRNQQTAFFFPFVSHQFFVCRDQVEYNQKC